MKICINFKNNDFWSIFGDPLDWVIHPEWRKWVTAGDKSGWMSYFLIFLSVFHDPTVQNYAIFYALSNGSKDFLRFQLKTNQSIDFCENTLSRLGDKSGWHAKYE